MSNFSLLLDVAKARQAEIAREAEITRVTKMLKPGRKSNRLAQKMRSFLASRA
jgi:hypothetical protein